MLNMASVTRCGITFLLFWARNLSVDQSEWTGALSWWKSFSGCCCCKYSRICRKDVGVVISVYSVPYWNKFIMYNSMNVRGMGRGRERRGGERENAFRVWADLFSCFWAWKITRKLVYSTHFLLFKCYFQHIESFHSIFFQYKAECDADSLFVQVCHFLFMPKLQMDEHRLGISTKPYSEITRAKASFQAEKKWLSTHYCIFTW